MWTEQRRAVYANGVIPGLYREHDDKLFTLICQPCDHKKLIELLGNEVAEYEHSDFALIAKKYEGIRLPKVVQEPLLEWIADYNFYFAYPMCDSREEVLSAALPERVLSYVYVCLSYKKWKRTNKQKNRFDFDQPNTEALYANVFDKSSMFKSWGLIPVDGKRELNVMADPVRVYDAILDKTIFVDMPRSFAALLKTLKCESYIKNLAVRSRDFYIYDGDNREGVLSEAIEQGQVFSWAVSSLPMVTKLFNEEFYDDCLWIKVEGSDITFEELCEDFYDDGDNVVTQMIHLQREEDVITHLDHEYIFYDLNGYEARKINPKVKGEARKRVKTFKIDNSAIPMNYPCKVYKDNSEMTVPFIFFVLNNYFEHKDLLEEYFCKIIQK